MYSIEGINIVTDMRIGTAHVGRFVAQLETNRTYENPKLYSVSVGYLPTQNSRVVKHCAEQSKVFDTKKEAVEYMDQLIEIHTLLEM